MKTGYLLLENGCLFKGTRFGAPQEVTGELVFTTAMTGYLETLTDPSFCGQMVVQTFPLIGNYGIIPEDFESPRPTLAAYIVREWCDTPSNFRCQGTLDDYLVKMGVPGLCGVDTRALTQMIRNAGVMNAALLSEEPRDSEGFIAQLKALPFHPSVWDVTCPKPIQGNDGHCHVVLWDFGLKGSIQKELEKRGCKLTVVPAGTKAEDILAIKPDGIMLSNGPGDPKDNPDIITQLKKLKPAQIPTFGICLGHHLLALSQGAKTSKMKYGHRGENQPVKDLKTGQCYITSQNHGYVVENDSLPQNVAQRYINGNDFTCEGLDYLDMPAFSVQFHPEGCGGPLDTLFLFDRFMNMMGGKR